MDWKDKEILLVGLGVSGKALSAFFHARKKRVWVYDDCSSSVEEVVHAAGHRVWRGEKLDYAVLSPGISPSHPLIQRLLAQKLPLHTEAFFSLSLLQSSPLTCVGITGTNGKSTTTSMLSHLFNRQGIPSVACGNIGVPLIELVDSSKELEYLFIELSSFQLEWPMRASLDAGIFINLQKDHLDRYHNLKNYFQAKWGIASCLKATAPLIINENLLSFLPDKRPPLIFFGSSLKLSSLIYQEGKIYHDKVEYILKEEYREKLVSQKENVLAALAFCLYKGMSVEAFFSALLSFSPLPHRLERLGFYRGVEFINDSKATNVASVLYAAQQFKGELFLIAGGKDKGESFSPWKLLLEKSVKKAYLFGETKEKISKDLNYCNQLVKVKDLKMALEAALSQAKPGSKILFSPGCSSFDMYKNYAQRGDHFKSLFNALTSEENHES